MRAGLEEIAADAIQLRFALEKRTEPHILGAAPPRWQQPACVVFVVVSSAVGRGEC